MHKLKEISVREKEREEVAARVRIKLKTVEMFYYEWLFEN